MAKDRDFDINETGDGGSKSLKSLMLVLVIPVMVLLGYLTATVLIENRESLSLDELEEEFTIADSLDGAPNFEYMLLTNINVNPIPEDSRAKLRILAINLGLAVKPLETGRLEVLNYENVLRDSINVYMGLHTAEYLGDADNRMKLKRDVKRIVNKMLTNSEVTHVYFPMFIIQ